MPNAIRTKFKPIVMTRERQPVRGRKTVSAMQLDTERYRHYIDAYDLDEAERVRLIEQVWRVAVFAMNRRTGTTPEQILLGIAGTKCPARAHDRLDSHDTLTPTFNDAADESAAGKPNP